jgi:hypothetical protein
MLEFRLFGRNIAASTRGFMIGEWGVDRRTCRSPDRGTKTDTRVWHKVDDKQGLVLALTGDTLHHFSFFGKGRQARGVGGCDGAGGVSPRSLMAWQHHWAPRILRSREELCAERGDRRLKDTARGYQHDVQE